jgi:hypothetical protein
MENGERNCIMLDFAEQDETVLSSKAIGANREDEEAAADGGGLPSTPGLQENARVEEGRGGG